MYVMVLIFFIFCTSIGPGADPTENSRIEVIFTFSHFHCLPRWLIRSGCGSKLRGAGLESRPGRILVIKVVHIQCSNCPGVCSADYGTVHYKEPLKSFDKTSGFLLSRYYHNCSESDVNNIHLLSFPLEKLRAY